MGGREEIVSVCLANILSTQWKLIDIRRRLQGHVPFRPRRFQQHPSEPLVRPGRMSSSSTPHMVVRPPFPRVATDQPIETGDEETACGMGRMKDSGWLPQAAKKEGFSFACRFTPTFGLIGFICTYSSQIAWGNGSLTIYEP